ncbi:MAG TPA: hypothetical protein VFV86_01690, partial [Nitrososphaeraceae archaeon]|nr:hypothetical protein [Nitrososphaeraceae archaeon]
ARLNRTLSFDTFNYHMKKLKVKNYIQPLNKNNIRKGQKLFYTLSQYIKQEIKLGIYLISNNEKTISELEDERERLTHIYYTVFYIIAIKPPPIEVNSEYQNNAGVSIEDLTHEFSSVLGYSYIRLTKVLLSGVLRALEQEGLIQKKKDTNTNHYRYFANSIFEQFISDNITTFETLIVLRYNYLWRVLRAPTERERTIIQLYWGNEYTNEQILNFSRQRKENKLKSEYKELRKKHREWVDIFDHSIYSSYNNIMKTYSNLIEKYPVISSSIIRKFFPKFLIEEIQGINKKYKNKKYPIALPVRFIN